MTIKEFEKHYVKRYKFLESRFLQTEDYVAIDELNFNAYSQAYLDLFLAIGSEVDIVKKLLARIIKNDNDIKDGDVNKIILEHDPTFKDLQVTLLKEEIKFKPRNYPEHPRWRTIYTNLKHNRRNSAEIIGIDMPYYQCANLGNVLEALAGLHVVVYYTYHMLYVKNGKINEPVPPMKSLFKIMNSYRKEIDYGTGPYFFEGTLIFERL